MRLGFTADQKQLIRVTGEVLGDHCTPKMIRDVQNGSGEDARQLWQRLCEMGLPLSLVDPSCGGLGLSQVEASGILVEVGRFLVPLPIMETMVVVAPLLAAAGEFGILERIRSGQAVGTACLDGSGLVPYPESDYAIVSRNGQLLLFEDLRSVVSEQSALDGSRPLGQLTSIEGGRVLDVPAATVQGAWLGGVQASAAALLGISERMLEMSVEYVSVREQFGKPVGSFQAVQHRLADVAVAIATARPMIHVAAWSLAEHATNAERDVVAAKASASETALTVARASLYSHGAIGYTTEYDLSLWMKRAWALAMAWGRASDHRQRLAELLGVSSSGLPRV